MLPPASGGHSAKVSSECQCVAKSGEKKEAVGQLSVMSLATSPFPWGLQAVHLQANPAAAEPRAHVPWGTGIEMN